MSAYEILKEAAERLGESVSNFVVGAISVDDLKPTDEKIKNMRESLKQLNARLLTMKARTDMHSTNGEPMTDGNNTVGSLQEAVTLALINNTRFKLCLHSHTIQSILDGREGTPEMQKNIEAYMSQLFTLNDNLLTLQESIENATQEQLDLQIECQKSLYRYSAFLKEQEQLRSKRLEETNPEIAKNKEIIHKNVQKINMMKRLITSFIASSGKMLMEEPVLEDMLEKHRELINIETILKMTQIDVNNEM